MCIPINDIEGPNSIPFRLVSVSKVKTQQIMIFIKRYMIFAMHELKCVCHNRFIRNKVEHNLACVFSKTYENLSSIDIS